MKSFILQFTRVTLVAVLAWSGWVSADDSLLPSQFPTDAPVHGNLWTQACGTRDLVPGAEQLGPGRYYDPNRKGHGWDFFWYKPLNPDGTQQSDENQRLLVTWYTYRREADGQYHPIWYGAVGDVIPEPGSTTRRAGFDGALWEFRHAVQPGDLWGSDSNVTLLKNVGAKHVGWVRLAFSPQRPDGSNDAGKAAVWWRFLPAAGQIRANGTSIADGQQCVQDYGRDADTNPGGGTGPMDGYKGDFVADKSSGWMVAAYFAGQTDYQMFMYFENLAPGSSSPTDELSVPRWINATRFTSVEPTHTCAGHGYEDSNPYPQTQSTRLCMFESKGYGADGSDPLPGPSGWDPVRDQIWRGSFFREFPSESTANFRIVSPEPGQSAPPLIVVDSSLTSAGGAVAHKITNLHEIRAAQVNAAGQLQPPTNAAQSCPVQTSGAAQGFCDLRLHWITNGFPVAAVYMKNTVTGERVLVRDTTPITPLDGYAYPARGSAAATQIPGGIAAGESVEFELYKDLNRTELLAKSASVTGVSQTGSCTPAQPTVQSPIAGGVVSPFRPTFSFTLPATPSSRYRIRLYDGSTFLSQYDAPAPGTGAQSVELPSYVSAVLTDPTKIYTWKVQSITPCGISAAVSNTFRIDAPPVADAAPGPTTPSYSSDSAPLVGEVPISPVVEGGAAAMSIPIEVAPGRHGMQPALSLDYSSRGGNGLAGMGWSLSGVSSIHRCPATLAQDGAAVGVRSSPAVRVHALRERRTRRRGAVDGGGAARRRWGLAVDSVSATLVQSSPLHCPTIARSSSVPRVSERSSRTV